MRKKRLLLGNDLLLLLCQLRRGWEAPYPLLIPREDVDRFMPTPQYSFSAAHEGGHLPRLGQSCQGRGLRRQLTRMGQVVDCGGQGPFTLHRALNSSEFRRLIHTLKDGSGPSLSLWIRFRGDRSSLLVIRESLFGRSGAGAIARFGESGGLAQRSGKTEDGMVEV